MIRVRAQLVPFPVVKTPLDLIISRSICGFYMNQPLNPLRMSASLRHREIKGIQKSIAQVLPYFFNQSVQFESFEHLFFFKFLFFLTHLYTKLNLEPRNFFRIFSEF